MKNTDILIILLIILNTVVAVRDVQRTNQRRTRQQRTRQIKRPSTRELRL